MVDRETCRTVESARSEVNSLEPSTLEILVIKQLK